METKSNSSRMPLVLLRSALVGSALGVALVALFALVLQKQWLGIESVPYVNSAIKIVSAAAAALIAAGRPRAGRYFGERPQAGFTCLSHTSYSRSYRGAFPSIPRSFPILPCVCWLVR